MTALAAAMVTPTPAWAAGCTVCICGMSTTALNFGTYNPGSSTAQTATATITVNCISITLPINTAVDLSLSAGTSGTAAAREMANGTSRLAYNIFQDAGYATIWGNGSNGGQGQSLSIVNSLNYTANRTAYGRIPANQYVRAGSYTDPIIVTFTF